MYLRLEICVVCWDFVAFKVQIRIICLFQNKFEYYILLSNIRKKINLCENSKWIFCSLYYLNIINLTKCFIFSLFNREKRIFNHKISLNFKVQNRIDRKNIYEPKSA